ncbi:class I SAM-dependent methyltransferase [Crocinitomix catalasitica]|nr:class I SAM-dependent methyltransferase [Crocinitomix catalasitica]
MECNICNGTVEPLFKGTILHKLDVQYYQCTNCQFIQTEKPYWLDEAYSQAIGLSDVGLVSRNIDLSELLVPTIHKYFDSNSKFVDYAGGYGMFVRIMRDKGLDFYRQDRYCENLFAKSFDITDLKSKPSFELLTAFEVFEHLPDPLSEIKEMFELSSSILFSTELQPSSKFNQESDWWYFSPEGGQHISLYTLKSLQSIATTFKRNLYTNGANIHLLTDKKLSNKILSNSVYKKILRRLYKGNYPSLLQADHEKMRTIKYKNL